MDDFEDTLKQYAIYSPDLRVLPIAPMQKLLKGKTLKLFSNGINARVYKFKDSAWVIKEGRWDLDINLFADAKVPFPAEVTEKFLSLFKFTFLPRTKEIMRQYRLYILFAQYFGYFDTKSSYFHPNKALIFAAQKKVRDTLVNYIGEVEDYYEIKLSSKIKQILDSPIKYHNFLPKEYLLYGKSFSSVNMGKYTYFIMQEFIEGSTLHDVDLNKLSEEQYQQLILMIFLTLLLNLQHNIVPDTRPRYPFIETSWFSKTDNVIVSKESGLKFIDTRWCWETSSNIVRRGLLIPNFILGNAKSELVNLLNNLA